MKKISDMRHLRRTLTYLLWLLIPKNGALKLTFNLWLCGQKQSLNFHICTPFVQSLLKLTELTEAASTTFPGSGFHELITLWLKKHFLNCSLFRLIFNFHLCPLNACSPPSSSSKKSSIFTRSKPFTIRRTWIKSPLNLLFSKGVACRLVTGYRSSL